MEFYLKNQQQKSIIQHFHPSPAKIRGHVTSPLIKRNCIVSERTYPHIFATINEQKRDEFFKIRTATLYPVKKHNKWCVILH